MATDDDSIFTISDDDVETTPTSPPLPKVEPVDEGAVAQQRRNELWYARTLLGDRSALATVGGWGLMHVVLTGYVTFMWHSLRFRHPYVLLSVGWAGAAFMGIAWLAWLAPRWFRVRGTALATSASMGWVDIADPYGADEPTDAQPAQFVVPPRDSRVMSAVAACAAVAVVGGSVLAAQLKRSALEALVAQWLWVPSLPWAVLTWHYSAHRHSAQAGEPWLAVGGVALSTPGVLGALFGVTTGGMLAHYFVPFDRPAIGGGVILVPMATVLLGTVGVFAAQRAMQRISDVSRQRLSPSNLLVYVAVPAAVGAAIAAVAVDRHGALEGVSSVALAHLPLVVGYALAACVIGYAYAVVGLHSLRLLGPVHGSMLFVVYSAVARFVALTAAVHSEFYRWYTLVGVFMCVSMAVVYFFACVRSRFAADYQRLPEA